MKIERMSKDVLIRCVNCDNRAVWIITALIYDFTWRMCDECRKQLGQAINDCKIENDPASEAVEKLVCDIRERTGLCYEWSKITLRTIEEIKAEWLIIIQKAIEKSTKDA